MKHPLCIYGAQLLEPRRLLATLVVNGSTDDDVLVLEADGLLTDGTKAMTVRNEDVAGNPSAPGPALGVRIDTVAPQIGAAAFDFLTSQSLRYTFSEDVGPTLAPDDLTLRNTTTPATVPTALAYAANVATFTWPAQPQATLSDGDYQATLARAGVSDVAGNALAADHLLDFFFLGGDANRDRRVNLSDFNTLAANFGQSGRNFTHGDFDYNGTVNLQDFNILASRFGNSVNPAAAAPAGAPATPAFGGSRIGEDPDNLVA